jgi:hypothetical protein
MGIEFPTKNGTLEIAEDHELDTYNNEYVRMGSQSGRRISFLLICVSELIA